MNDGKQLIEDFYGTTPCVYFDIETIPTQSDAVKDSVLKNLKAPGNYKKPEAIEAWKAENAQKAIDKTSFDGGRGHVCTISWALNEGPIETSHGSSLDDEAEVLTSFFSAIDGYHSQMFVGHNVAGFDVPFLTKRALVLGVRLPRSLPRNPKAWDKKIHDTMHLWDARDMVGMDALCEIFGMEGKGDFDGSMVADAWAAGEHQKISLYAAGDVARTRAIHQRFLAVGW